VASDWLKNSEKKYFFSLFLEEEKSDNFFSLFLNSTFCYLFFTFFHFSLLFRVKSGFEKQKYFLARCTTQINSDERRQTKILDDIDLDRYSG
jgi:hypothetical protein